MAIAARIREYLDQQGVEHEILPHPYAQIPRQAAYGAGVDANALAQGMLLKDWRGILLAVFPADHELDIATLNAQLRRTLTPVAQAQMGALFGDCEPGAVPALGAAYGIKTILAHELTSRDTVYFQAGSFTEVVRVSGRGFQLLQKNAWRERAISYPAPTAEKPAAPIDDEESKVRLRDLVSGVRRLPAMPEMAQRIMQLRANPYSNANDLARVIELDPSLAAQVIRYARSPLFGYRGNVVSIQQAVSRVLGYDMVLNVALGIATGSAFRNPSEGPLGLEAYWQHSVYCATLVQALGSAMPHGRRPRPGLAYLAGLLHDFGLLFLGHLFPQHFARLNSRVATQPEASVIELERQLFDTTHTELGAYLMESWHMPGELLVALREHHNEHYDDVHAVYARLVLIANHLLAGHGYGTASALQTAKETFDWLELSESQAQNVLTNVLAGAENLDLIARQFAA